MPQRKRGIGKSSERYLLERSPLAQNPTQRDLATLVGESLSDLKTLATPCFKEQFLVRRTIVNKGKTHAWPVVENGMRVRRSREDEGKKRELVYPEGRLRAVHERLKYHLSKIIQPSYLMSPRKGRAQRDNAAAHLDAIQFLTLDLKQFYPSTTRSMIRNSLMQQFGMSADTAGLIAHLSTADERACFGSPVTPVLASLVHRHMFDQIAEQCVLEDLSYTVWVDDLTISGDAIKGNLKAALREIVSSAGMKSHKLKMFTGNKPVFITGVGVVGSNLILANQIELRSMELWHAIRSAQGLDEIESASRRLLAHLGGIRSVVGPSSARGQKLANEMHSIRQKRDKARRKYITELRREAEEEKLLSANDKPTVTLPPPF